MQKPSKKERGEVWRQRRRIRNAQARTVLLPVGGLGVGFILAAITGIDWLGIGTFALAIVILMLDMDMVQLKCPDCGKRFFVTEKGWCNVLRWRCVHCGSDLSGDGDDEQRSELWSNVVDSR
jgi:DNA-directed RNA polymerase subunit RPC12/RpoP